MVKCHQCKQKISLVEETMCLCKCERNFCTAHRHPTEHNCTFDWKSRDVDILSKKMTKCVPQKITVI